MDDPVNNNELLPVDSALRQVEQLSAIGVALSSLEFLARPEEFLDTGLLGWQVGRTRYKWTSRSASKYLDPAFQVPGIYAVIALRFAAALALMNPKTDRATRSVAVGIVLTSGVALNARNSFGTDGTEHMNLISFAALAASKFFPQDRMAREACAWFIAYQSCLSYFASGLSKLTGAPWRQGTAVQGVLRTHTYGSKPASQLLRRYPILSKMLSWGTIAGETVFPAVLVAPKNPARALLGTGVAFHLGNAVFMGLNRFLWAFCGTYPAVMHCSKSLSAATPQLAAMPQPAARPAPGASNV